MRIIDNVLQFKLQRIEIGDNSIPKPNNPPSELPQMIRHKTFGYGTLSNNP